MCRNKYSPDMYRHLLKFLLVSWYQRTHYNTLSLTCAASRLRMMWSPLLVRRHLWCTIFRRGMVSRIEVEDCKRWRGIFQKVERRYRRVPWEIKICYCTSYVRRTIKLTLSARLFIRVRLRARPNWPADYKTTQYLTLPVNYHGDWAWLTNVVET